MVQSPGNGASNLSRKKTKILRLLVYAISANYRASTGTRENPREIQEQALNLGDQIQVGSTILILPKMERGKNA